MLEGINGNPLLSSMTIHALSDSVSSPVMEDDSRCVRVLLSLDFMKCDEESAYLLVTTVV